MIRAIFRAILAVVLSGILLGGLVRALTPWIYYSSISGPEYAFWWNLNVLIGSIAIALLDCVRRYRGSWRTMLTVFCTLILGFGGLFCGNYRFELKNKKHDVAVLKMREVMDVLEQYRLLTGDYPSEEQGLDALTRPRVGGGKPLLKPSYSGWRVADPWGNGYGYAHPGSKGPYDLVCFGSDGVPGGIGEAADICSWELSSDTKPAGAGGVGRDSLPPKRGAG